MTFIVEINYFTRLGNLKAIMTTQETVETRVDAEEVRTKLKSMPQFSATQILIKNAPPLSTPDEAIQAFLSGFSKFPVVDA